MAMNITEELINDCRFALTMDSFNQITPLPVTYAMNRVVNGDNASQADVDLIEAWFDSLP